MRTDLTAQEVANYLARHPDFFQIFPDLVEQMRLPHPRSGESISLLQRQLISLRDKKETLEQEVSALLAVAGDNGRLFEKLHQLTLALMAARSESDAVHCLLELLPALFAVEQVRLHSWQAPREAVKGLRQLGMDRSWVQLLRAHLQPGKPRCGALEPGWQTGLFEPEPAVRSVCLVPLGFERVWGVLAIGSHDAERFAPELDTYFLRVLGELISARLGHLFGDSHVLPRC
ncbi:hypothetical protein SAMN05443662_1339 [Sulfurivirga caldicuralii]|uniref:DUF484 domain-containing protein n=1 Tax=Sulfurivirga caldicuralii TaxID=364032 RepID=A0A1N6GHB6_9GAMM|nr:DUF484 family protein [Sulfurivirga caldicuralii]SIO06851.1 hypothetical protein SAMN05443662_1339 [Sulfurivirga caldicuralii]